jgi:hypothetical protein
MKLQMCAEQDALRDDVMKMCVAYKLKHAHYEQRK